ncbi:unnamed protein product [Amoebophrya sp. A120]|nr:unnamed protein product [Amoebophrya sp. A120]|eukprot:GSA120T00016237001.1
MAAASAPPAAMREGFATFYTGNKTWKKKFLRLDANTLSIYADSPEQKKSTSSWFGALKSSSKQTPVTPEQIFSLQDLSVIVSGDSVRRKYKREFVIELAFANAAKPVVFQANTKAEFVDWKDDLQHAYDERLNAMHDDGTSSSSSSSSATSSSTSTITDSSVPKMVTGGGGPAPVEKRVSSRSKQSGQSGLHQSRSGNKPQHPLQLTQSEQEEASSSSSDSDSDSDSDNSSTSETDSASVTASEAGLKPRSSRVKEDKIRSTRPSSKSVVSMTSEREHPLASGGERRDSVKDRVQRLEQKLDKKKQASPSGSTTACASGAGGASSSSSPLEGLGGLVLDTNHLHLDMPVLKPMNSQGKLSSQGSFLKSGTALGTPKMAGSSAQQSPPPWIPTGKPSDSKPTPATTPPGIEKEARQSFQQQFGQLNEQNLDINQAQQNPDPLRDSVSRSFHPSPTRNSDFLSKSRRITDSLADSALEDALGVSLHNVCTKRSSMSISDRPPKQVRDAVSAVLREEQEEARGSALGTHFGGPLAEIPEHSLKNTYQSICEQEEISFKWDERLRFYGKNNPQQISQLLGEFTTEAVEFSRKFIDHLCYSIPCDDVERARQSGMVTCALNHGIFYRLIVDADDHTKDETELALNGVEVRSIRFLVANIMGGDGKKKSNPDMIDPSVILNNMKHHGGNNAASSASANNCPFNGHLTVTVDYAGFRVFCQAVQPLEECNIACGWYPDKAGRLRYIEPDAPTKEALKLVQDTLNLKRTMLKLKDNPNARRIRLSPAQLLHKDTRNDKYYLGRQRTSLLAPLAESFSDVNPHTLNFLRPEMQVKLPFSLSPVPSFDFCAFCVDGCPQTDTLRKEIVEAYGFLKDDQIPKFVEELESGKRFPVDSKELRHHFHSFGINMTFLGYVYSKVSLPYIKHLILCDAIARVIKRGIRECCHNTMDKDHATAYASTWFSTVMQYESKVWTSIREWLQAHYTFQESDVVGVDFSTSIHAPILLQSMAHHCGVHIDTENQLYPTLRKEWRKVGLFVDFVPTVKTLCYRKCSHSMLNKERWTTKDFVKFVEHEQKLAKPWLCGNGAVSGFSASAGQEQGGGGAGQKSLTGLKQDAITGSSNATSTIGATLDPAESAYPNNFATSSNMSASTTKMNPAEHLLTTTCRRLQQNNGYLIDKSGSEYGLDQALRLYIDHLVSESSTATFQQQFGITNINNAANDSNLQEAKAASKFALQLFEDDPNLWLTFASQAYQHRLFDTGIVTAKQRKSGTTKNSVVQLPDPSDAQFDLSFEDIAKHIEYNFGEDHPLLLDFWRQRLDTLYQTVHADVAEILSVAKKCVELSKAAFGRVHGTTAWYHSLLGHVYVRADMVTEAINEYQRSLDLSVKSSNKNDFLIAGAYSCLRDAYCKKGDLDKASEYASKVQKVLEKLPKDNNSSAAQQEQYNMLPPGTATGAGTAAHQHQSLPKRILINLKHLTDIEEMRGEVDTAISHVTEILSKLQRYGTELELSRNTFEFQVIVQAVRLSICSQLPEISHRMKWERKFRDMERIGMGTVNQLEYQWTISDLSELPDHVAELLQLAESAVVNDVGSRRSTNMSHAASGINANVDDTKADADKESTTEQVGEQNKDENARTSEKKEEKAPAATTSAGEAEAKSVEDKVDADRDSTTACKATTEQQEEQDERTSNLGKSSRSSVLRESGTTTKQPEEKEKRPSATSVTSSKSSVVLSNGADEAASEVTESIAKTSKTSVKSPVLVDDDASTVVGGKKKKSTTAASTPTKDEIARQELLNIDNATSLTALDEIFQLVKFCDPDFTSMFELRLHAEVVASPNC